MTTPATENDRNPDQKDSGPFVSKDGRTPDMLISLDNYDVPSELRDIAAAVSNSNS